MKKSKVKKIIHYVRRFLDKKYDAKIKDDEKLFESLKKMKERQEELKALIRNEEDSKKLRKLVQEIQVIKRLRKKAKEQLKGV